VPAALAHLGLVEVAAGAPISNPVAGVCGSSTP
jgi:hypothetical protein